RCKEPKQKEGGLPQHKKRGWREPPPETILLFTRCAWWCSILRSMIPRTMLPLCASLMAGVCAVAAQAPAKPASSEADTLMQSAKAAQQHGDLRAAIENYRKALTLRPDLIEAHMGLGTALMDAGRFDEAIDEDQRALAAAPNDAALGTNLGLAYYRKGDLGHARAQFELVHQAHPEDVN